MTHEQFKAIAALLRLRGGKSQTAARLICVEGFSAAEAAAATGLRYDAVHKAMRRVSRGMSLARRAVG